MSMAQQAERAGLADAATGAVGRRLAILTIGLVGALAIAFLATFNLENYPTTWFDEGSHLHVPKTLVQHGVYADISSEGFRYFGPTTGVGPTVLLPIALAFKVAGIGLLQARLVIVAYMLVALVLFALVVRRRYCWTTTVFAVGLLLVTPGVNLLYLGRQVLGEVPALAFFLLGVLLWWRSAERGRGWLVALGGAGLAFGLAALTKSQFGVMLLPTFVVLAALDRFYYRQLGWWHFIVPLGSIGGAMGVGLLVPLLPLLGTRDFGQTLALWREASAGAIFVLSPARIVSSFKFLSGPDAFAYWALPALAYGVFLARQRSLVGLQQGLLVTFAALGLAWYALGSIGWPRYAFPALAVATIFVAKFFRDVFYTLARTEDGAVRVRRVRVAPLAVAWLLGVASIVGHPLLTEVRDLVTTRDRGPQLMATYLDAHVSPASTVETWEPELGFLTDHRYHYPPLGWLDRSVRARWLAPGRPLAGYDPLAVAEPAYLVVGPFGKYTGLYADLIASGAVERTTSLGQYDLYQVNDVGRAAR